MHRSNRPEPKPEETALPVEEQRVPASITVSRRAPEDVGFREVYVSVDDDQIAVLEAGHSVTRQLPPGRHRILAHNTLFYRSHEIDLKPGEHRSFRAVNRAGWGTFSLMTFLGAGLLYLTFEPEL